MAQKNRSAFTLVELLVVIVIIGMLAALLLQAVIGAREAARRTQCLNYQKELAAAIAQYEQASKHLPGYVNANLAVPLDRANFPGDFESPWLGGPRLRPPLSWAIVVLPYLGREDLSAFWRTCRQDVAGNQEIAAQLVAPGLRLAQFVCPSDGGDQRPPTAPLSYAVNCGLPDQYPPSVPPASQVPDPLPDGTRLGLFYNLYQNARLGVKSEDIKDGASETLMLSENLQAYVAIRTPPLTHLIEADVGMVWWPAAAPPPATAAINQGKNGPPGDINHARPSSNHPGGVVAAFCDGSARFISQDISYREFQQMMCPNDNAASALFVP